MKRVWLMLALGALAMLLVACGGAGVGPTPAASPLPSEQPSAGPVLSDAQFLAAMIEHHQGALEMAEIALPSAPRSSRCAPGSLTGTGSKAPPRRSRIGPVRSSVHG